MVRPRRETYLLQIHRSRAVSGWQWAALLVDISGGESLRFSDPEALLTHLRRVVHGGDQSQVGDTDDAAMDAPAASVADQGDKGVDGDGES
jgi:hypothetical protein